MLAKVNVADDAAIPYQNQHITKPALFIACTKDHVGVSWMQEQRMRPWAEDMRVKELDAAHWVPLEKPEEVNLALQELFDELEG